MFDKKSGQYSFFKSDPDKKVSSDEMVDYWAGWVEKFPIRSIEDGLAEDDWEGWSKMNRAVGRSTCRSSATICS